MKVTNVKVDSEIVKSGIRRKPSLDKKPSYEKSFQNTLNDFSNRNQKLILRKYVAILLVFLHSSHQAFVAEQLRDSALAGTISTYLP